MGALAVCLLVVAFAVAVWQLAPRPRQPAFAVGNEAWRRGGGPAHYRCIGLLALLVEAVLTLLVSTDGDGLLTHRRGAHRHRVAHTGTAWHTERGILPSNDCGVLYERCG